MRARLNNRIYYTAATPLCCRITQRKTVQSWVQFLFTPYEMKVSISQGQPTIKVALILNLVLPKRALTHAKSVVSVGANRGSSDFDR